MRFRTRSAALAAAALAACSSGDQVANSPALLTSVACTDAGQHRQRAADDRKLSDELSSDQERIYVGNRANFSASLAIIANLQCRAAPGDVDSLLAPAFEAAHRAQESSSLYARAFEWGKADFIATQVIATLVDALPEGQRSISGG